MQADAIKWDQKHMMHQMPQTPSDLLIQFLPALLTLQTKHALDIACGNGRNAKFLAQNGFSCDAMDISKIALKMCEGIDQIKTIYADFDLFRPKPKTYDVILNFYFLNRQLFPSIIDSLKSNGIFLLETFIKEEDGFNSSGLKDDWVLDCGELDRIFAGFKILHNHSHHSKDKRGKIISFVAQKS